MQDQAINPALVARVRKLLNMTEANGASQNEAEQAQAQAQSLMMKHNISIALVEASHDTSTVVKREKARAKGRAMYAFQQDLMRTIASANFVFVSVNTDWNGRRFMPTGFTLVGREENVAAAQVMFDYLASTIERLGRDYVGGDNRRLLSNEAISFKKGMAEVLSNRIARQHREMMAEQRAQAEASRASSGGTALVVVMEDFAEAEACANEDFRLNLAPGTTAAKRVRSKHLSRAWDGVWDRLNASDMKGVEDEDILRQVATEAAHNVLDATGMTGADLESAVKYAVESLVKHQVKEAAYASGKAKRPKASRGRSYGHSSGGSSSNTNWRAHDAGRAAGERVSLNKQVNAGSNGSKKLLG